MCSDGAWDAKELSVETVLGLSVTATNVQTVLVEGRDADGATLEHDEFDVFTRGTSHARACEQVAEAVLSIAEADGLAGRSGFRQRRRRAAAAGC
jgi:hypothetical protein